MPTFLLGHGQWVMPTMCQDKVFLKLQRTIKNKILFYLLLESTFINCLFTSSRFIMPLGSGNQKVFRSYIAEICGEKKHITSTKKLKHRVRRAPSEQKNQDSQSCVNQSWRDHRLMLFNKYLLSMSSVLGSVKDTRLSKLESVYRGILQRNRLVSRLESKWKGDIQENTRLPWKIKLLYEKFCGTGGSIRWYIAKVLFDNT